MRAMRPAAESCRADRRCAADETADSGHRKAQELLKELKDARQTVELMDACGKRVCSSEEHWGCPYGNEGMTDCAVLLEAAYEDAVEKLLALKETLEG